MGTKALEALLTESNDYPTPGGTVGFALTRDRLIAILWECTPRVSIGAIPTHYDPSGDGTTFQITVYATFSRSELGMKPRETDQLRAPATEGESRDEGQIRDRHQAPDAWKRND